MEKEEKIIIVGKSGSGKDYLLRNLVKRGLKYSPKFTTRPKRELEVDGREYNFITTDEFHKLKESDRIKVYQSFLIKGQDWFYGITKENFNNNQAFIMTPAEISQIPSEELMKCFVVYLDISMEVRRSRIKNRNDDNDSVERRLSADEIDFADFKKYDLKISDPDFEPSWIYDLMF